MTSDPAPTPRDPSVLARRLRVGVAAVSLGLAVLIVAQRGPDDATILSTPRSAVACMNLAMILIWPVVAGVAAADAVATVRVRGVTWLGALRLGSQIQLVAGRVVAIWASSVAGLGLAALVFSLIAVTRGGSFTAYMLWDAVAPITGALAYCAFGWFLGAAAKSWFVPPFVTLVLYGAAAINANPFNLLLKYAGGFPPYSVTQRPLIVPYALTLALFAFVVAASVAGSCWSFRRSRDRVAAPITLWLVAALAYGGLYAYTFTHDAWTDIDHASWPCVPVSSSGASLCGPVDHPGDLEQAASAVAPLQARLEMLDARWVQARWVPGVPQERYEVMYELPLGVSFSTHEQARSTAYGIVYNCYWNLPLSGSRFNTLVRYEYALALWLDPDLPIEANEIPAPGLNLPISLADAQTALGAVSGC